MTVLLIVLGCIAFALMLFALVHPVRFLLSFGSWVAILAGLASLIMLCSSIAPATNDTSFFTVTMLGVSGIATVFFFWCANRLRAARY